MFFDSQWKNFRGTQKLNIHFSFRKSKERKRNVFFDNQSTYKLHVGGLFPYIIDYTRAELRKIYIASK